MLPSQGVHIQNGLDRTRLRSKIPCQCHQESEIQHIYFSTIGEASSQLPEFQVTSISLLQVLYNQFKFFLNMFFLVMALSQFIPQLQIGYLYTYWGPLGFVLAVTTIREAIDDIRRCKRDREVNSSRYAKLTPRGKVSVTSAELKVGDIVFVDKGSRVPADMVLLRTSEHSGSCFIRTDQLDGETDWKLRIAVPTTQKLSNDEDLLIMEASIYAEKPQKDIHSFIGKVTNHAAIGHEEESLSIENTIWANTVVASGTAIGIIIYSGPECRAAMNNSAPRSKVGLIDLELNQLTKVTLIGFRLSKYALG